MELWSQMADIEAEGTSGRLRQRWGILSQSEKCFDNAHQHIKPNYSHET